MAFSFKHLQFPDANGMTINKTCRKTLRFICTRARTFNIKLNFNIKLSLCLIFLYAIDFFFSGLFDSFYFYLPFSFTLSLCLTLTYSLSNTFIRKHCNEMLKCWLRLKKRTTAQLLIKYMYICKSHTFLNNFRVYCLIKL